MRGLVAACVLVVSIMTSACDAYDPSLIREASIDAAFESGDPDSGVNGCVPSTQEFCDEICPETCNNDDDDCDERVDEDPSGLCDLQSASATCVDGLCIVVQCLNGAANCDGDDSNGCEARLDSPQHCSVCNLACDFPNASARCEQGVCVFDQCLAGYGNCDGDDANGCELRLDSLVNCGACGTMCEAVEHGQPGCIDGMCGVSECDTGFANCDNDAENGCEAPLDGLEHCGECGETCAYDHAEALCAEQSCVPGMCVDGYGDCDNDPSNECESNLNTNPQHCGTCGRACDAGSSGGSMFQCVAGQCVVTTCPSGFADCDQDGDNGCETSLHTLTDCGACDTLCNYAHASETCDTGTCAFGACDPGFGDCANGLSDGCETQVNTNTHCGACGAACGVSDSRECSGGVCSLVSCPSGSADCDNDGVSCEQSLSTLLHCGACNSRCGDPQGRLPNATANCGSGACAIGMCDASYANCDNAVANGCETSLRTTASCGACGSVCARANASVTCATGSCALGVCNTGFGNCDSNAGNGCETPTNTISNCGACGTNCARSNATMACTSGMCMRVSCNPGFGDCDGNAANGCEQTLNTLTHCGACNSACALSNGAETCTSGTCTLGACDVGFGNCDFTAGNGCETPLNTNGNCNACGAVCDYTNASESCSTRTCTLSSCNSGFGDCDGNNTNGCEQAFTSNAHCGACNNACDPGERCENNACVPGFPYTTSNFNSTDPAFASNANVTLGCTTSVFNSTPGAANGGFTSWCAGQPMPTVQTRSQGTNLPDLVILSFASLTVSSGATLQLIGTRPVILAVFGNATLGGTIDGNANGATPGAGGNFMCGGSRGTNGGVSGGEGRGGGGGGFAGVGGRGGNYSGSSLGGPGGSARGATNLQPLLGGCDGGLGGGCSAASAGGGAIQISVGGTLTLSGTVRTNGSIGGTNCGGQTAGGGGGSGGAILIEANVLNATGATLQATGGRGGHGADGNNGGNGSTSLGSPNGTAGGASNDGAGGGGGAYGRAFVRGVSSCAPNNIANTVKGGVCL